ncbi:MAG: hypothetical protein AVDCRST_MAG02-3308 [uncultured Rubrobacteraceae bacterium]|uniref:DUF1996 domain-containing protein n=1 Tax=uncultured Rubrobacteraceae bacterium TaxID=349277 RepID=A0A6J4RJG7_9ACTN|nr:MAG: hypothetical protein AVDCRST_MAG02-3308 [uncultured Rubrobacteraceae bacterium]
MRGPSVRSVRDKRGTRGEGVLLAALTIAIVAVTGTPGADAQPAPKQPAPGQPGAQFAAACGFGHTASADPIVDDPDPHLHDFFGNASTSRGSTYDSLRGAGTGCFHQADRSAWWVPAIKWDKKRLAPSSASIYYRAAERDHERVRPHPSALKMIAGGLGEQTRVLWSCGRGDRTKSQVPPRRCESGVLAATVYFPDCWDGRNLDSADHRYHVEYAQKSGGARRCPGSYPVPLPGIDATFFYSLPAGAPSGRVLVSAGHGSWEGQANYHADFFNAWDQKSLTTLVQECINGTKPAEPLPDKCRNPTPRRGG